MPHKHCSDPSWTKQKIEMLHQHDLEWKHCYELEKVSLQSLLQTYWQQRGELDSASIDELERKTIIQHQIQTIKTWRADINKNRHWLQARQADEISQLNAEELDPLPQLPI